MTIRSKERQEVERLLGVRRRPLGWRSMSVAQALDYIATRILAEDRHASGITSHADLRETGILSESQLRRRQRHEVYCPNGLDTVIETHRSRRESIGSEDYLFTGDVGEHAKMGKVDTPSGN